MSIARKLIERRFGGPLPGTGRTLSRPESVSDARRRQRADSSFAFSSLYGGFVMVVPSGNTTVGTVWLPPLAFPRSEPHRDSLDVHFGVGDLSRIICAFSRWQYPHHTVENMATAPELGIHPSDFAHAQIVGHPDSMSSRRPTGGSVRTRRV